MKGLKIVSSHFEEDVSWLENSGFPYLVISKGSKTPSVQNFVNIPNRGLEFGSYVWYILNHWDYIPDSVAFIHGHRESYHQQRPVDQCIIDHARSNFAFLNGEFSFAIHSFHGDHPWFGRSFAAMWNFLGLDSVCSAPLVAPTVPGTQTLISRDLIKSRGKAFWERISNCMLHESHYHLALVMEIAWPMIFGFGEESFSVDEFRSFFDQKNLSVLIAHPKEAWNSSMPNTVKFDVPESRDSWISCCMGIFQEFAKVY